MAATLGQRIQDLVGFDYSDNTMNTEDEALETACVEVIDSIPETILLKYATSPQNLDSGTSNMDIDGRKIIRVLRFDNHGVTRVCEKVDIDEFHFITNDASSIYRPTKYSPVWTEDPETGSPKLEIFPGITGAEDEAESAKVYYIDYPTGELVDSGESIVGVPNELEHAVLNKDGIKAIGSIDFSTWIFNEEYGNSYISLVKDNGEMMKHPSLNIIKQCALLSCAVDYTPNNQYMTYSDERRSMVQYTMNLQFNELDPIYEMDYYDTLGMQNNTNVQKIGY